MEWKVVLRKFYVGVLTTHVSTYSTIFCTQLVLLYNVQRYFSFLHCKLLKLTLIYLYYLTRLKSIWKNSHKVCMIIRHYEILQVGRYFLIMILRQKQPPEVFCKKRCCLEILENSQENTCARICFLIKLRS